MKKPVGKVVALHGAHNRAVVTQDELAELEQLQRMEWMAGKKAHLMSERLRDRIEHSGAVVEEGRLYYDLELEMVRSRKFGRVVKARAVQK